MMDRARWQQIEAVLDEVLDTPAHGRAALLAERTAGDPELRREVESLLAAHGEAGSFLETPAVDFGAVFGVWRIERELGRGGMGAVYLATRADGQFEQRVALKVVKRGMDSAEIVRRFRAERQILARLDHPNIARLVDGGTAPPPDGRPWLALDYVEGEPITRTAEQRGLDVTARVLLFEQVCEAVRYAHQNLVVHRDLKPSNILVTPSGEVKLLDFGIAKVLHGQAEDGTTDTAFGSRALTPEYGAPEQVRGESVTTKTDVYALGAVLYELLTGRRAHNLPDRSLPEVLRVVCEVEPLRPSLAAGPKVARVLAGDLDTIILKALQKEPARRYESVEALLDDLRRYRTGLPVRARPDSRRYRFGKFVRRYRVAVTAAAIAVLALVGGLAAALWQAQSARHEAARAKQVKDVAVRMFEVSVIMQPGQQVIYPRELLDQGAHQVDSGLAREPALRQELLARLGRINRTLGYYAEADSLFARALRAARVAFGPRHLEVAARLEELAALRRDRDDDQGALGALREALDIRRALQGPRDPATLASADALALTLGYAGSIAGAESLLVQSLASRMADALGTARRLELLGTLRAERHDLQGADSAWSAALALAGGRPGADSIARAALDGLVATREALGDAPGAERFARRRLALARGSTETADAQAALAQALAEQGKDTEAESLLVRALATQRRELGDDHPATIATANDLALLHGDVAALRRALALSRVALGPAAPTTVTLAHNLAALEHRPQ